MFMFCVSVLLQKPCQVLVHQELHVTSDEALCAGDGGALWLPLSVCHLQVAVLPAQTGEHTSPVSQHATAFSALEVDSCSNT